MELITFAIPVLKALRKISLTLTLSLISGFALFGQGNKLNIQATPPKNMTVCGVEDTSLITVYNISSSVISGVKITLLLPSGVTYVAGSLSGTGVSESNITNLNRPVFAGPSLLIAQNFRFRVKLKADCDIVPLLSGGGSPQIDVRVDYTGNFDNGGSIPFVPVIPSPGYSSITNTSYIGNVGDKFVRKVTIANYGKGPMATLRLMRINGKDLKGTPQSGFNSNISGDTVYTYFTGSDFKKFGDGDTLFEQNESIVITDTFTIIGCNKITTYYEIGWGCNGKICQIIKNNAAVTISGDNPNLKSWTAEIDKLCYDGGTPSTQFLTITNTGKKDAKDVTVYIYVGTNAANTYLDTSLFYLRNGSKSASKKIAVDSASRLYTTISCVSSNALNYVRLKLGNLPPGDTLYLNWNMFRCAITTCNSGFYDINWIYSLSYKNQCNSITSTTAVWGKVYRYTGGSAALWVPTDLARDETKDFKFNFNSFYDLPLGPGARIIVDLVLPATLEHSLNKNDFLITNGALTSTWYPDSLVRFGDTIRAYLGNKFKFNLSNAEMTVKLKGICSKYNGNTALTVRMNLYYNPEPSCNSGLWIRPICASFNVKVHCSNSCKGGMWFKNFSVKRTSFGAPDNDNDGLADGSGSLDMTKVRSERVMYGDTFLTVFTGRPKNATGINNWRYGYAESYVTYGSYVDVISAELIVYKGITLQSGTCNTVRVKKILSGANATFKFDFTVDSIYPKGCLSSSYRFTSNDSIMLKVRYRVSKNISGSYALMNFTNRYYLGSVANPGTGQYYQCDTFGGNLLLYGYYYANCCSDNVVYSNCAEVALSQSWYLGMGPCCVNYAGNNLFPYEFRNFTKLKALRIHLPSGLKLINTYFGQYRTTGVGSYLLENVTGVQSRKGTTSPIVFEFDKFYKDSGGTINPGDDGVQGYFTYTVQPRCNLPANTPIRIDYDYIFERKGTLGTGFDTLSTGSYDLFTFNPPQLKLQPAIPTVYANSDTVEWEVRYSNPSAAFNAYNIWLSPKPSSNIKVVEVRDMDKDTIIKPSKDIYRAGILDAGKIRRFKIRAVYNDCDPDSLILFGSYNCAEYPVDFASYPCTPNRVALYLEPQNTRLQLTLTDSASTLDLCATNKLTLLVENIQAVTTYNTKVRISLPIGMQVVGGSAKLKYPLNSSAISIGIPKLVSGTIYEWDLPKLSTAVASGFKGTTDTSKNKMLITFRVVTNCDYASGSFVSARALANIKCGDPVPAIPAFSNPLDIKGVTRPYYTLLKSWADTLLPCEKTMNIKTRIVFLGPGKSGTKDLAEIFLPDGVSWDNSFWNPVRNAPHKDSVWVSTINGATLLSWRIPAGILPGDSLEFDIRVLGDGNTLHCGPVDIISRAVVVQPVVCISTGTSCDIKVITGSELVTPLVDKGILQIESATISAKIIGSDSESVKLNFVVRNKGRFMSNAKPIIVHYYYDINQNGKWDNGDTYLSSDTTLIALKSDSFFTTSRNLIIKAGQSCAIIAVLDSSACSCIFGQKLFPVPALKLAGNDTAICSTQNLFVGNSKVNGFDYYWNNDQVLDDVNLAKPRFVGVNQTGVMENYMLILTTDRGICFSKDTVNVTLYPVPILKALLRDTQICKGKSVLLKTQTFGGSGNNMYSWNPSAGLADPTKANTLATPNGNAKYYLTVTDSRACKAIDSVNIVVRPYPLAHFTWPVTCQGQNVLVTDSSIISSGSIVLRTWKTPSFDTFGVSQLLLPAGAASTLQVTLIAESDAGCADTVVRVVDLKPIPQPYFTAGNVCLGDSAYFVYSGNIASGSITNWKWSFGDSKYSSAINPSHKYTNFGDYSVKLYTTSNFGCTDSFGSVVRVFPLPKAVFTSSPTCEGDSMRLQNNSLLYGDTLKTYTWNFGSLANGSTLQNPSVATSNYGKYPVVLLVESLHGCADSLTKDVVVDAVPEAGIWFTDNCFGANSVFHDSSKIAQGTIQKYNWNFGDVGSSAQKEPVHSYAKSGTYNVSLKVVSDRACADSITRAIWIMPLANPVFSANHHCFGEPLVANSTYWGGGVPSEWKWYLGNGDSFIAQNVIYNYANSGNYLLRLQITTDQGCKADTQATISVYPKPVVSASAINPCNDDSIVFTGNGVVGTGSIAKYIWTISDGSNFATKNANGKFAPAGNYSSTLVATSDRGCMDSAIAIFVVKDPVRVFFTVEDVCIDEITYFRNNSTSAEPVSRYVWDFGDGKASADSSPAYLYSKPGNYLPTLTLETKPGCIYSFNGNTTVHDRPRPAFAVDPAIGTIVNPNISVIDMSSGADSLWYYTSDGFFTDQRNFSRAFPDSGSFRIWQIARTNYDCMDSTYKDIYINFMFTLHVPTAFTPNVDSKNENFGPGGMGIQWYSMKIYSRWGELVYETNDSRSWDGKINGEPALEGVYAVLINLRDYKGYRHVYHGTITLLK